MTGIRWFFLRLFRGGAIVFILFFTRLLIVAPTTLGSLFSAGISLLSLWSLAVTFGQGKEFQPIKVLLCFTGSVFLTLALLGRQVVERSPTGSVKSFVESTVSSTYFQVMSEEDLIEAFSPLLYLNDPARGLRDYNQLKQNIQSLYKMGREYDSSPSMLWQAFRELMTWNPKKGDYFIFIPEQCRIKKCPLLLFLHGAFGNLKAYMYALSGVARGEGVILVAPSYGIGMWFREETPQMLADIVAKVGERIQYSEINILGYSNGAMGALLSEDILKPHRIFLLCPMLPSSLVKKLPRGEGRNRITIVYGADDVNTSALAIEAGIQLLTTRGYQVGSERIPSADHYLLFRNIELVQNRVTAWLRGDIDQDNSKGRNNLAR
jgi:hypothetical protein